MNQRRKLLIALGYSALVAPFATLAQQPGTPAGKIWRIGYLSLASRAASAAPYAALVQRLRELGYTEGGNLKEIRIYPIDLNPAPDKPKGPPAFASPAVGKRTSL